MHHNIERPKQIVEQLLQLTKEIIEIYEQNQIDINLADQETQDLLHELELNRLDCVKLVKGASELAKTRRKRRSYKHENEMLHPLYKFVTDKNIKSEYKKLLTNINKINGTILNRSYYPRVRVDLSFGNNNGNNGNNENNNIPTIQEMKERVEMQNAR